MLISYLMRDVGRKNLEIGFGVWGQLEVKRGETREVTTFFQLNGGRETESNENSQLMFFGRSQAVCGGRR